MSARSFAPASGFCKEQEDRKRAFDAMIDRTLEEVDDKGTRAMDDVLARADAAIKVAER